MVHSKEKSSGRKGIKKHQGGLEAATLNSVVKVGLSQKMIFGQRPGGDKGVDLLAVECFRWN